MVRGLLTRFCCRHVSQYDNINYRVIVARITHPLPSLSHQTTLEGHGLQPTAAIRCLACSNSKSERISRNWNGRSSPSSRLVDARSTTARRRAASEYAQPPPTVSDDKYTGPTNNDNKAPCETDVRDEFGLRVNMETITCAAFENEIILSKRSGTDVRLESQGINVFAIPTAGPYLRSNIRTFHQPVASVPLRRPKPHGVTVVGQGISDLQPGALPYSRIAPTAGYDRSISVEGPGSPEIPHY